MVEIGGVWDDEAVLEVRELTDGRTLVRTGPALSEDGFGVTLLGGHRPRGVRLTPAHLAIDFYGKRQYDRVVAGRVLQSLVSIWHGKSAASILERWASPSLDPLPGYGLDCVFVAAAWMLEQRDGDRELPERDGFERDEIDGMLHEHDIAVPEDREGSAPVVRLFCEIADGTHPATALGGVTL